MKICSKCKEEKELINFGKRKNTKDGFHVWCKLCIYEDTKNRKEYRKEYNISNSNSIKQYRDNYTLENKEQLNKNAKERYYNNLEYYREYNKTKSKESIKIQNKKQTDKGYKKEWSKKQYEINPIYRISQILRTRFLDALKSKNNKFNSVLILLDLPLVEFKLYLESKFLPEMNWDNHGIVWELDHITPCSKFDLTKLEQQKLCFHYTNTQPLFKTTEIAKSFGYINQIGNRNKKNN